MKNFLIGLLTLLVICSIALNVFLFVQLQKRTADNTQTQPATNVITSFPESNDSNFNTNLIGEWTDGKKGEFQVIDDGSAYFVSFAEWEGSEGKFVYRLEYGYMDGSNFVVKQVYQYNDVKNGGDGIFRHSEEEVITNCLHDVKVATYRIVLEGNTITGFGTTTYQFLRENS